MRIRTNTTLTPTGKVKVKTTVKAAPMMPALRSSATFSVVPAVPTRKKRRRPKKR